MRTAVAEMPHYREPMRPILADLHEVTGNGDGPVPNLEHDALLIGLCDYGIPGSGPKDVASARGRCGPGTGPGNGTGHKRHSECK